MVKKPFRIGLLVLIFWFPVDLIISANRSHSKLWEAEHIPTRFNDTVNSSISDSGYPPSLSGRFLRYAIWDFNQINSENSVSTLNHVEYPSQWADFLLVESSRLSEVDTSEYHRLGLDAISKNILLKRKQPWAYELVKDTIIEEFLIDGLYNTIFDFNAHYLQGTAMNMYYDIDFLPEAKELNCLIVCTLFDTTGTEIFSNSCFFNQVRDNWGGIKGQKFKLFLPMFPKNAGRFTTYVFNPKMEKYKLSSINSRLEKLYPRLTNRINAKNKGSN
jgi:hypothetical protein